MGLGDMISSTLRTVYKVDTSDHKKGLRDLQGEEKKRHKALIEQLESQNKKLDDQIAFWGKVAGGAVALVGVYKALDAGFEVYAKNSRLRAANLGTDLGGLQKATRGLVDETRLLEFSAAAMNGTFKLTQKETEAVLQGALALRKTMGVDLTEALDRVQQAVTEGNVEPLKQLGVVLKASSGTAEASAEVVRALSAEYQTLGGNVEVAGDSVVRAQTEWANSVDSFQESMGKLAESLAPVVSLLAKAVAAVNAIPDWLTGAGDLAAENRIEAGHLSLEAELTERIAASHEASRLIDRAAAGDPVARAELERRNQLKWASRMIGPSQGSVRDQMAAREWSKKQQEQQRKAGAHGFRLDFATGVSGLPGDPLAEHQSWLDSQNRELALLAQGTFAGREDLSTFGAQFGAGGQSIGKSAQQAQEAIAQMQAEFARLDIARKGSMLQQVFGTPNEFALYQGLFSGLTGSVTAAFGAWMDGSQSAGKAFEAAIGQMIRSLANQMLVQSVQHTAMAIGALAIGGPIAGMSAAAHGKAAAAFAAGAVLAGSLAKVGGGGGSAGAVPAVSGLGRTGGGGGGAGGGTTVVLLDSGFTGRNPRAREDDARRALRDGGLTLPGDVVERN